MLIKVDEALQFGHIGDLTKAGRYTVVEDICKKAEPNIKLLVGHSLGDLV